MSAFASGQVRSFLGFYRGCVVRLDVGSIGFLGFTLKEIDNLKIRFNQIFGYNAN